MPELVPPGMERPRPRISPVRHQRKWGVQLWHGGHRAKVTSVDTTFDHVRHSCFFLQFISVARGGLPHNGTSHREAHVYCSFDS